MTWKPYKRFAEYKRQKKQSLQKLTEEKIYKRRNFTEEEKNIEIKGSYIDLILGKEAEILNIMKPYGVYVLKKNK